MEQPQRDFDEMKLYDDAPENLDEEFLLK